MALPTTLKELSAKIKAGDNIRIRDFAAVFGEPTLGPIGFAAYANNDEKAAFALIRECLEDRWFMTIYWDKEEWAVEIGRNQFDANPHWDSHSCLSRAVLMAAVKTLVFEENTKWEF